jgi:hypothetical protein
MNWAGCHNQKLYLWIWLRPQDSSALSPRSAVKSNLYFSTPGKHPVGMGDPAETAQPQAGVDLQAAAHQ